MLFFVAVHCRAAKIMASSGHQVTLTVAKQGAVYHGLAMLICQEPPQMLPSTT